MLLQSTVIAGLILLAALLAASVRRIPEGHVYSLYRFGRPQRMLHAGLHLVLPLVDRVAHKISLTGHVLDLAANDSAVHGRVYWQVLEPDQADAVIGEAEKLVQHATLEALAASPMGADEVTAARALRVKQAVNQRLRPQGMLATRVELS